MQKKYKAAVDALFNTLRGTERDRSMNRFREKVSSFKSAGGSRLRSSANGFTARCASWSRRSGLLENNIGFFAKSKNAEALIADVKAKIERARDEISRRDRESEAGSTVRRRRRITKTTTTNK